MRLPTLTETSKSKDINDAFAGYNHNLVIGNGEFYDMQNMTSEYYPVLSPKNPRESYRSTIRCGGAINHDGVVYVDGEDIVIASGAGSGRYDLDLKPYGVIESGVPNEYKSLISFGSNIIVMPDKKYINTLNPILDCGDIEAENTTVNAASYFTTSFSLCDSNGNAINPDYTSSTQPSSPSDGEYWIDTSGNPHVLKKYSSYSGTWMQIPTTYVKVSFANINSRINIGDGINIEIVPYPGGQNYKVPGEETYFSNAQLDALNGSKIVMAKPDVNYVYYIVVEGMLDASVNIQNKVIVSRKMPKMDIVFEANNRLWGCRWGQAENGQYVNEIYASALGDFKNWNKFEGISTDSYVASVGASGAWTGGINYRGIPCFFKKDGVYMVYGDYPSNYQLNYIALDGVDEGSKNTLCSVEGILYYKSQFGFMAFNGSSAEKLPDVFGDIRYASGTAGSIDGKYYVCLNEPIENKYNNFVYDTRLGVWMKTDRKHIIQFFNWDQYLFSVSELEENDSPFVEWEDHLANDLYYEYRPVKTTWEKTEWFTESGKIGTYLTAKKYISRIAVRLSLAIGSLVRIYIMYDSDGKWNPVLSVRGTSLKSFYLPIRPHRCDHFRIRIEGVGEAKIYSIDKTIEEGSEH